MHGLSHAFGLLAHNSIFTCVWLLQAGSLEEAVHDIGLLNIRLEKELQAVLQFSAAKLRSESSNSEKAITCTVLQGPA